MKQLRWKILLVLTACLFLYSILTRQLVMTILSLGLSIVISKQNLFKEYDEERDRKRQMMQETYRQYRDKKAK